MQKFKPCARCEEELPLSAFDPPGAPFCRRCMEEALEIARSKYGVIEAAHLRAQLRHRVKERLQKK